MACFYILNDVENKMTVYFITRHKGALEWAKEEHVHYDVHVTHLANFDELRAEDTVIGTLPIHLVADLHVRGIRYVHLSMHVPAAREQAQSNRYPMREVASPSWRRC